MTDSTKSPVVIGSGTIADAEREIAKYIDLGFDLHTFIHVGEKNIGGDGPYTQRIVQAYTWLLIKNNAQA